jgi:hypothetical protein
MHLPVQHDVLIEILRRKHPCSPAVGKIAVEFVRLAYFTQDLLPRQENMWWCGPENFTFPAGSVGSSLIIY